MAIQRKYRLNLRNYGNLPAIMVSQYDGGYNLVFEIYDGASPASNLSAYTVTLKGTRYDGLGFTFAGTVANNVLSFLIDNSMTAVSGRGSAEVVITDNNDLIFASFNLHVFVEKAVHPDSTVDADTVQQQTLLEQIQAAASSVTDMTVSSTTLAAGSEATVTKTTVDDVINLEFGLPQGATGATGATPNLTMGTVTTLDPDDDATATITGTAENPVLNLGLPKGRTGEVSQAEFDEVVGDVNELKSDLNLLNSHDLLKGNHTRIPFTANGITWTWNGESCSVSGTATASTVYDLYRNENALPSWLSAGQTVYIKYSAQVVRFTIYKYVNGTFNTAPIIDTTSYDGLFTIPADATGITIRFRMAKNTTANESVSVIFANYESNEKLQSKSLAIENAKMLSVGNSILTGSVWINGNFNHLSTFANAPYGWIANALGITEQNVDHTLISSTGLMYDAGEGSFLDNILDTDITGYDYILTHLYYQDLTSATSTGIGALDSTSGDGTVAGAVLELLNYIRTNNANCMLVLIGVPPAGQNGSDIGDEVFSAGYSNGANIMECDYLMHQLAEQEHFIFVDWEDLELSYHWKDFTDNLNIHLNNEDTYRVVGEYLGNQITAQKGEGDSNRVVTRCCKIKWILNTYINRDGVEAASNNVKVSDFIPVVPGETICLKNVTLTTTELIYLTCYDITKNKIADAKKESGSAGSIVSEVEEYIVPSTGAYIRVTTASTQAYCHVWHKDKTYIPHPHIEAVTDMIIGENNAFAVPIYHYYIEGKIINPNNVGIVAENWANTGIVPLNGTYDYIKLLNVSAGQGCFALFLDNDQKVISVDLADSNGVLAAERIIKPPVGATYIRCNMLKANKDIFKIYGLKTNLVVRNAVPESANQTFHVMTGNKLHTIFRKTKAIGSLFTISDDDTTSLSNVQKFHTVCMTEGIRGCYAVMTKNTEADSNIVDALREYEKDGFQNVLHCNNQRAIFKPAPDRDIDACREDIAIAIQRMQSYGFSDYRHWVSPYGAADQEMKDLARDFGFDCLILVAQPTYCHFIPQNIYGMYSIPRMELYPTDAESAPGNTLAEIKAQMLDCATNGGWFHLCTHMYQWGDDLSRVTEILQYANSLGMKNVTISGGLSYWRDIYHLYDLF